MASHKILFVCLGNICRSPVAEGVFAHVAEQAGHGDRFKLDSAGTGSWHVGNPPDPRSVVAAAARGIDLSNLRARQVCQRDFMTFDLILAMDAANHATLLALAPQDYAEKIQLFLNNTPDGGKREVPDPYYGGEVGFEDILDLVEEGSRALLARLT
jgi:protein-tyrosine phosphatase